MTIQAINPAMKHQQGAILITALVMLVLLTLLGLSSMSTTTMEERMAANTQTMNRAFQAASTGIEIVYNDEEAFSSQLTAHADGTAADLYNHKYNNSIGGGGTNAYDAVTTYNSIFIQKTKPNRGTGKDIWGQNFSYYHFDLSSTGCIVVDSVNTDCNSAISSRTLHQGVYQIGSNN